MIKNGSQLFFKVLSVSKRSEVVQLEKVQEPFSEKELKDMQCILNVRGGRSSGFMGLGTKSWLVNKWKVSLNLQKYVFEDNVVKVKQLLKLNGIDNSLKLNDWDALQASDSEYIEGSGFKIPEYSQQTALFTALINKREKCIDLLIKNYANLGYGEQYALISLGICTQKFFEVNGIKEDRF
jgi:hypothetical protein